MAKMSINVGPRRGSDNFNFNFDDMRAKAKALMSQSIEPQTVSNQN